MIKFDNDLELERDVYGWKLIQWRDGVNPKTKDPTRSKHITYHPTLMQICREIIDRKAGESNDIADLISMINDTEKRLGDMINRVGGEKQ